MINIMERDEVKKKLIEIVIDKLECEASEIKEDTRLSDLGADSLDEVELLMEVEKEFHIYIKDEEADKVITCGDAFELVCKKVEAL